MILSDPKKTAIVTGASKGIGAAIALRLARDGFAVIVNYASSQREAQNVVSGIEAFGGRAMAIAGDIADANAVSALFDAAEESFGPVDVLVNNAGLLKVGPLATVSDEDFQRVVSVNLTGTFNGMREGARRLRDDGRIISLSSSIIGAWLPAHGAYVATKAAIEAMTHTLAKELGPRRISVNAVAPGPIATELLLSTRSPEVVKRLIDDIPLGRLGEPEDIAGIVSFLAGPDSGWINGQVLKANGGRN